MGFKPGWPPLLPFLCLLSLLENKRKIAVLIIFLAASSFCAKYYIFPKEAHEGTGHFFLHSSSKMGKRGFYHKGELIHFSNEKLCARHIPCAIFTKNPLELSQLYFVEGKLQKKRGFSLETKKELQKIRELRSLISWRQKTKSQVNHFIKEKIKSKEAACFISSLLTGVTQDPIQRHLFTKLGLAHLFAVSGFHFVLVAYFFRCLLRPFFTRRMEALLLFFLLTCFFIFMGASASVQRAWSIAIFSTIALFFSKEGKSLNTFGLSLLVVLATDLRYAKELSFQLSFLATFGILLFYPLFEALLSPLFPRFSWAEVKKGSFVEKVLFVLSVFLKKALSLNAAVHALLLPILFFVFHSFPLHSLLYNLFFPFLVSIALFLFLFTLPIYAFVPMLGKLLFSLTTIYTTAILEIVEFPPFPLKTVYVESFSSGAVTIILTVMITLGILGRHYLTRKKEGRDLHFQWIY